MHEKILQSLSYRITSGHWRIFGVTILRALSQSGVSIAMRCGGFAYWDSITVEGLCTTRFVSKKDWARLVLRICVVSVI